ncbi:nucleoside deaminase [Bifidobacterium sp. LC6]|uniref:tRNA-specific adenosine deaminase n=1 Tax=Bifidobacterium colobi TaxID=2809026 RepID=A0ABS5UXV7_9BIFI|nr:nucleoside deaminase [Bifidobacterium colobi]MBT1175915.1 nucleoside deaminase [Bifidobacterium colobi]
MRQAIALARRAAAAGDVPVGAVVLDDSGAIIGRGYNTRETHGDPLAHAEILAMREAAQYRARQNAVGDSAAVPGAAAGSMETDLVGCDAAAGAGAGSLAGSVAQTLPAASPARAWNLADCTLVVTLEPCPMCAGACIQTHIGTIVFGAWDAKLGACGSVWDIPRDPHIGHAPEVHGGILEGDCQAILTDFFAARR